MPVGRQAFINFIINRTFGAMNLADYISELLAQHDEVSVPGLGAFVREHINAYYNDKEAKFYPPCYRVAFVDQLKEDNTFTQYLAGKKNISLASAKYFTEKFITKLREDAVNGAFLFSGLGSFVTERGELVFKPNDKITSDPSFYGYPTVGINKVAAAAHTEHAKPVFVQPVAAPIITATALPTAEPEQYFEDEPERKKRLSIWLILLIVVAVIAGGIFAVYEFYPDVFANLTGNNPPPVEKKAKIVPTAQPDTTKALQTVADTTSKTDTSAKPVSAQVVNPPDTIRASRWEIIIGQEVKKAVADAAINQYKEKGVDAKIVTGAPGKGFMISAGAYPTRAEANAERLKLISAKKIYKDSYPLEIKPQK
ncbi:MAG TPA: hypothetical protein VGN20_28145 [Mucilaginibacter sp.]|jgi:hypothetical protein